MKRIIKTSINGIELPTIRIQMYIKPIFYEDSKIASSVKFDKNRKK